MGEDRIPTMPQVDDERIATMPQTEGDVSECIPTMPQMEGNVERIATMPQADNIDDRIATMPQGVGGDRIATMPQGIMGADGRVATMPQQSAVQTGIVGGKLLLSTDINFTGNKGGTFTIEANNVISADSGESQIYACHKVAGNDKYVARVLISITPDSDVEKRVTRDKVIRFLDTISAKEDSHILPLVEYGEISIDGKNYYVEIYPFCENGDLGRRKGQISFSELQNEIIPAINEALHLFHNAGLVHRDVKPDNLYKYNGKVVIADFGITCDLRDDGFATDKYKTGTLGYYAPELMSQAAIKASDYYSFGQTIWTLYSGEMMYRNILRRYKEYGIEEQRNQVNFAMLNNVYYGLDEINQADAFFEILVRGLLQYDPSSRFGYEQVVRWINGDKSVVHDISKFDGKGIFKTPFKYNGRECWDTSEIYSVLVNNWENAKELLYTRVLKDFFVSHDFGMSSEIDKIVKTYSTKKRPDGTKASNAELDVQNDVGLSRFFMLLNNGETLVWRGTEYKNLQDLSIHLGDYLKRSERSSTSRQFDDLLSSELIGYWYQYQTSVSGAYDEGMADVISNIRTLANAKADWIRTIAYTTAFYLFAGNIETIKFRECRTVDELGKYITQINEDVYRNMKDLLTDPYFYGFLFVNGYADHANHIISNLDNGRSVADIEMLFDFLSVVIEDKEINVSLLDYYVKHGPSAHLYWWKNNLGLYSFNSADAISLKDEIERSSITTNNINDCRSDFKNLEQLSIKFREMFVDNIFLAQIGLTRGKTQITSTRAEAYWHYDFLDREAPIGFCAYIERGGVHNG